MATATANSASGSRPAGEGSLSTARPSKGDRFSHVRGPWLAVALLFIVLTGGTIGYVLIGAAEAEEPTTCRLAS